MEVLRLHYCGLCLVTRAADRWPALRATRLRVSTAGRPGSGRADRRSRAGEAMKLAVGPAMAAGGILAALLGAGCGARAGGGPSGGPKAVWRRRAAKVAPFLSHLITGPAPAASSLPVSSPGSGSSTAASGPIGSKDLPMDVAALVAWLITAGSGTYVLAAWISRGATVRQRAGSTGSPPAAIFGHFGLALSGLVIWVVYLIAGWPALAWTAVGVLLQVAGLGMATVFIGLPGRAPDVAASG